MERTKEQKKAIALHGCNILVAAAAGSGKTSVLIERILSMISSSEHPIDIDRLLVVTFTNAAAAEMRERMEKSLEKAFEQGLSYADNKNLQKQIALLHKSHIMTIDSFCAEVLRNHFQEANLDPSFRIADNAELKLLQEDILADVLETAYQEAEKFPGFLQFVDSYAPGRSDEAIETIILSVYNAAAAYPDPEGWLLEKRKEIEAISTTPLEEQEWMKKLLLFLHSDLESYQKEIVRLIKLCEQEAGLIPYQETLELDLELFHDLLLSDNYISYANAFSELSFARLGRIKKAEKEKISPDLIQEIKDGRDTVKTAVSLIKKSYFPELSKKKKKKRKEEKDFLEVFSNETEAIKQETEFVEEKKSIGEAMEAELRKDLLGTVVPMLAMYDIILLFLKAYQKAKMERNILDFSDQEHLALKILVDKDGTPTKAALELREYFEEIMIDEYQDSNRLQEVILTAISKGNNLFMVGDVKQSIYKFRLARPELFMEKYHKYQNCNIEDTFGKPEAESHKIDLSKNFRSRQSVLDIVNYLFSRIMGSQLGNIEYDKAAALYYGAGDSYLPNEQDESEIILVTPGEKEKKNPEQGKIELEAAHIAARIQKLVLEQKFQVRDNASAEGASLDNPLRPIRYGDIAILLRTMSGWSEIFLKILQEMGIPAVTATAKGYFEASEVKILLNLLKLIDNEQQDIPLAAVMLSPIGGFSEMDLAIICSMTRKKEEFDIEKKKEKDNKLYNACREFIDTVWQEDNQIKLQQELQLFFKQIGDFRSLAACLTVPELMEQILMITGYDDCVRAMPDGEKRYGNVRMLIQKAGDFEKTSYHGLFQFNRYMERLKKYEIDFGEAETFNNIDAVQIMSIHKSKGLEFPVVFVSGLGKQFNLMDTRKNIVIHQELFAGADFVDLEKRIQVPTVLKKVLQKDMIMETLAEELRVLYVAMTRAKEKLILTGYVEKTEEKKRKWIWQGMAGKIPIHVLENAKTFLDLIMPVFLQEMPVKENNKTGFDTCKIKIKESSSEDLVFQAIGMENTREWKRQDLLHHGEMELEEEKEYLYKEYKKEIFQQMEEVYPYQEEMQLKTKFTVSELKRASAMEEWESLEDNFDEDYLEKEETFFSENLGRAIIDVPDTDELLSINSVEELELREKLIPSFIKPKEEKKMGGVMIGTLYHEVMCHIDFTNVNTIEKIREQLNNMKKKGILEPEGYRKIKVEKLQEFLACPIGKRIVEAQKNGKLFREQPFVMGMDAAIFLDKNKKTQTKEKENKKEKEIVLVQGVIDLFFEENGKLILLDYKTDRVKEEKIKKRYLKQLEYYGEALKRTRNLPVEEKYLYSFHLGKLIACE